MSIRIQRGTKGLKNRFQLEAFCGVLNTKLAQILAFHGRALNPSSVYFCRSVKGQSTGIIPSLLTFFGGKKAVDKVFLIIT